MTSSCEGSDKAPGPLLALLSYALPTQTVWKQDKQETEALMVSCVCTLQSLTLAVAALPALHQQPTRVQS